MEYKTPQQRFRKVEIVIHEDHGVAEHIELFAEALKNIKDGDRIILEGEWLPVCDGGTITKKRPVVSVEKNIAEDTKGHISLAETYSCTLLYECK